MENKNVRRRIVREKVVQALYAHEISKDPADHVIEYNLVGLKNNKDAYAFAGELVRTTIDKASELDELIKSKVANWDFKRIAIVDRVILRMALCELYHFPDIPTRVTMNEAIELAKLFSTEKSGQFVNGVLDAVVDDLKNSGIHAKKGRGLSEGSPRIKKSPSAKAS